MVCGRQLSAAQSRHLTVQTPIDDKREDICDYLNWHIYTCDLNITYILKKMDDPSDN